ncbi:MAG: phosphonate ABC transporter, permease protein PhnE, partial [Alphaproteobacteria bacterium]|nr:phosphonate ABC transporter, permease protein PhnE [Alphaproteobacteria bacterium]
MADSSPSVGRVWTPPPLIANATLRWFILIGTVVYLIAAFGTLDFNWQR